MARRDANLRVALFLAVAFSPLIASAGEPVSAGGPVDTSKPWQALVHIGAEASYRAGSGPGWYPMTVSPTLVDGEMYVPYDLTDAWRELDSMLPKNFVALMAEHSVLPNCYDEVLDDDAVGESEMVAGFLREHWLDAPDSRLFAFFKKLFDVSRPGDSPALKRALESDLRVVAAEWTLCTFYNWKRAGEYPGFASVASDIRVILLHNRAWMPRQ